MREGTFVKIIGGNKKYRGRFGQVSRNLAHGQNGFHVLVKMEHADHPFFQELCFRDNELKVVHIPEGAL